MARARVGLLILLCFTAALPARAAETPIPASPTDYVTDTAGFLSPATRQALTRQLENYARTSGHQVIVWIGQTTGDAPIEDWAVRAFAKWKVGRQGLDDGLALFIMAADHKIKIEIGYGLEAKVTDAVASRIINDVIVPRIRAGDNNGAVSGAVARILGAIDANPVSAAAVNPTARATAPPAATHLSLVQTIFFGLLGLLFLFLLITHPSLVLFMLLNGLMSSGRGGGGGYGGGGFSGGGGGGFSGGGGRSGGGGATGSW